MLGIVVLNYKDHDRTIRYVKGQLLTINIPYKIAVVDISATESSSQLLSNSLSAELLPLNRAPSDSNRNVFVVWTEDNLGYARGNNLGAEFLISHFDVKWLLITNNDLIINEEDVVKVLVRKLEEDLSIGAIGPKVIGLDGRDQSPHRCLSIWSHMIWPKLLYPLFAPFKHLHFMREVIQNAEEGYYYRIIGCFLVFRYKAFKEAGGFDSKTFLYGEEQIMAERMLRVGYRFYYLPEKKIIHDNGRTVNSNLTKRERSRISIDSLLYYYRTYRNASLLACDMARFSDRFYWTFYEPILSRIRSIRDIIYTTRTNSM